MTAEIVVRPATGGVAMNDQAIDECDDAGFLIDVLFGRWLPHLRLYLEDPEWPLHDEGARRAVMGGIAQMGFVLARLTQLVDAPPEGLTDRALSIRAIREATEELAARGYPVRDNVVDFLRSRGARLHLPPTPRPAAESSCPPPSTAPQDGAERSTA